MKSGEIMKETKQPESAEELQIHRETAPDYAKWRHRLFIMNLVIAIGTFALEVGVNIILQIQGKVIRGFVYQLVVYLLLPSGLNFGAVFFDSLMMKLFPKKDWLLNTVMVMTVVFMCLVVATTHYIFSITLSIFVIPLMLSMIFASYRLTDLTALVCCLCVFITGFWRMRRGTEVEHNYLIPEMVISVGIIVISLVAARIVIHIMTEQNEKLLNAIRREKHSQEEALAANRAKSVFLANMSHEIRTPINAILGMNELILREEKVPELRDYSENIRTAGNSLLALISDVLDISKIESGKLEIIPCEYELNSLVSDCCSMTASRARSKGLELSVECEENVPRKLFGDETHIRQIIVNLLTNAVKYTEQGSVTLSVTCRVRQSSCFLRFSVKDTGIGISQEDQRKLFGQFQRLDLQKNRHIEGTGLGLSIVKQLCELMNGTVTVNSAPGEGSEFTVELPQKVADPAPCGGISVNYSSSEEHAYAHSFEAPGARILAVDDLPVNLRVIVELLKDTRIRTDTAGSGAEFLLKASKEKYDLILMDHMMPEMDGIEAFRRLRTDDTSVNQNTPVIMLTANALSGMKEEYLSEGFADYLSKPIRGEKLEEAVRRNLPQQLIQPVSAEAADLSPDTDGGFSELQRLLPGFNLRQALSYCCGSGELLAELLRDFAGSGRINVMEAAFSEGRLEDYCRCAHSLKSTALTIGLAGLSARARASEIAIKNGCAEFARLEHEGLMSEYRETLDSINTFLEEKGETCQNL